MLKFVSPSDKSTGEVPGDLDSGDFGGGNADGLVSPRFAFHAEEAGHRCLCSCVVAEACSIRDVAGAGDINDSR